MAVAESQLTPMMAQYRRIKGELPKDALLLFRLGDFYEMFFEDAQAGAQMLNLALTSRNGVPMCGLPFHAANAYIGKILRAGRKVAICEQLEDARPGKLVKREVTQILSPGTHFDERILAAEKNNFLASIYPGGKIFGLALVDLKTIRTFQNFRPLVIRIDDLGRAEAINYHNLEYKPQDAEAKYFLSQFCALYYRRNRYTIQDDFSKSLYFLDGKLADGILDAYRKDDIIKKFITNTAAPEIDVQVKKVALEEMQTAPFRARVDFYMVYYSPADHSELKRDLYTANFVFVFKTQVPNELIPINPLGITITYFREDEAFK